MSQQDTLGQRIRHVRYLVGTLVGGQQPSQKEFGKAVGERIGRKPFSATTVGQWEKDKQSPDIPTVASIASMAVVDPGWLAFGLRSDATAPPTWLVLNPVPLAGTGEGVGDIEKVRTVETAERLGHLQTQKQGGA